MIADESKLAIGLVKYLSDHDYLTYEQIRLLKVTLTETLGKVHCPVNNSPSIDLRSFVSLNVKSQKYHKANDIYCILVK